MCCINNRREKWVISLVLVGVFFSLGVAVPMILISFPGNECLLFVSVRGEALIYGHPAGCNFISAAHSLVAGAALVFFIVLVSCRRGQGPGAGASKNPSNGSVRSLRGSMATVTSSFGPRAKPTITLIVFSTIMFLFVLITAVVILSGYVVTCGELQYETRRNLYSSLPLGTQVNSVSHWCWSLFRDTDYHTRFHFDHYELSGQWLGQYTANRHGRPKTWTGSHKHLLDIATGLEMCLGCSWLGAILWAAITTVLILHRRSVKSRARADEGESLEDARIWATDMSPGTGGHYEKINMQSVGGSQQYETIRNMQTQGAEYPPPPSDASDVDTLLAHQNVIASSHPDGSYFMTQEGQYVQLINGVLTHVDITPSPPVSVTYSQPQFQNSQMGINGVHNAAYPGYPSLNPSNAQSMPVPAYPQPQQLAMGHQAQNIAQMNHQAVYNQFQQQPQHVANLQQTQAVSLPASGDVQSGPGPSRPLMASSPMGSSSQSEGEDGRHRPIRGQDEATRLNMRRQMDVATAAGMKCSQF